MPVKDTTPNHVCERCGKEYFRHRQSRFRSRYCSRECMYMSFRGEGNPNYRHGQNLIAAREFAKRHTDLACVICGFSLHVEVHHIQPREHGGRNTPENLVVLCPNHHWMAQNWLISPVHLEALAITHRPKQSASAFYEVRTRPTSP